MTKLLNNVLDDFRKELRKSDKENANYKPLKWILHKQYHKQLDELDVALLTVLSWKKSIMPENIFIIFLTIQIPLKMP